MEYEYSRQAARLAGDQESQYNFFTSTQMWDFHGVVDDRSATAKLTPHYSFCQLTQHTGSAPNVLLDY